MRVTVLTRLVAWLLLAPVLAVAAAVLVKGYADVGDGFAAGVIAALGVLLQYVALGRGTVAAVLPVRHAPLVAAAGMAIAVAVALVPALAGGALLEHAPEPGADVTKFGSLELITAVAFDVGVFGLVLGASVAFIDVLAVRADDEQRDREGPTP